MHEMKEKTKFKVIGRDYPRVDVTEKVRGEYEFVGDIVLPGLLHCKVLRSPHAHALVKKIDTDRARRLPGVKAVITHKDVADKRIYRVTSVNPSMPYPVDSCILEEHVRHVGDRVAAVAATSVETAEEALELIDVEYEELPAVFDPVEAIKPGAPAVHEAIWFGDQKIPIENNTNFIPIELSEGDVEKGFKQADLVVENEFRTGYPHNAPLGRPACICRPLPRGGLEVWNHTQGIHPTRQCLASTLGIPLNKIKVHRVATGGAFGFYIYLHLTDTICAFLALKTGLPVKLEESREEMFYDGGRHPAIIKLKTGVMKDGTLVSMEMNLIDGVGAYGPSPDICGLESGFFMSKYRCPNKKFSGRTVYTNTPPLCSMRGAGDPQVHFAVESQMDIIAEKLGLDPLELRLKNGIGEGDTFIGQAEEVFCQIKSCGTEELIKEGARRIGWENRKGLTPYKDRPWIKRGIGMASGFHTSGAGSKKPASYILDYSGAVVKMNEDGTANLIIAAADFGSGNITGLATMAAEELGLSYEDIIVSQVDTDTSIYEFWIHASRSIYSTGGAIKAASRKAKNMILDWAARLLETPADELETGEGRVFKKAEPSASLTIREVLEWAQSQDLGTAIGVASYRATACPPHFVVTFIEVDVDTMTGEVRVVRAVQGADAGTPINPGSIRGQLCGGLHMGMGYALVENVFYDPDDGRVLNHNFRDYKLLTPVDMPEIETFLAETVEPTGPFGAKGIGEGVTNPVAPAVYNAVYNAVGARVFTMPLTPEKVLHAMKEQSKGKSTP